MNDVLIERFRDEIRKALPSLTADELLTALTTGEDAKARVKNTEAILAKVQEELVAAKAKLSEHSDLEAKRKVVEVREAKAKEKEESLALREGLVTLRELHAVERVKEMRGVVSEVFANSKLKYSVNRMVPMQQESGGFVGTYSASEAGEKEV